VRERALDALACEKPFVAHPGWRGHVESGSRLGGQP